MQDELIIEKSEHDKAQINDSLYVQYLFNSFEVSDLQTSRNIGGSSNCEGCYSCSGHSCGGSDCSSSCGGCSSCHGCQD